MMFLSGLVGFLLLLTAESILGASSGTDFCPTEECLLSDVFCTADNYLVRHYEPAMTVAISLTSSSLMAALYMAFAPLNDYMHGANDMGVEIDFVAPILIKTTHSDSEQTEYVVMLPLPAEHQAAPPNPTNDELYIHGWPHLDAYVLRHDEMLSAVYEAEASQRLKEELDAVGANYVQGYHVTAEYHGLVPDPASFFEVLYVVVGDPVCGMTDK